MASGINNLPTPGMTFSPFDPLTAEEQNQIVENVESLADGTGIGDGAVTASKLDLTTLVPSYFSGTNATIQVTAPYNCIFEVEYSDSAWGFSGATLTISIANVAGLTTLAQRSQSIVSGNTIGRSVVAKKVFSGGTLGSNYTFSASIAGAVGGRGSINWMVKCIRA